MRYIIATLGCKVNQYESEAMEQLLKKDGHTPCPPGEQADAILINSCAVTAEGERKVRQTARRLAGEHPGAFLALCGCWSQIEPTSAAKLGARVLFGTGDRQGFVRAVEQAFADGTGETHTDDPFRRREFEELPAGAYSGHARAYLKIQDGCDNFCTYCIIPYARGRVLSLPRERCAAEFAALAAKGYREIVITGIEIASWGRDLRNGETLIDALEAMGNAVPEVRMHLGSLEPTVITDEFTDRLGKLNITPHFHLSLQSGSDAVLRAMHRKYDTAAFYAVTERLRSTFPDCSLTTDLITGFPGETEENHAETLAFIRKCGFAAMHIFPYSRRPGTKADAMPRQLPNAVKSRRAKEAQEIAAEMKREYLISCVGKTLQVLFETERGGISRGHAENYTEVEVGDTGLRSMVKSVKITGVRGDILVGLTL